MAISGFKSIFPATRDLCLQFLLTQFQALSTAQQGELAEHVRATVQVSFQHVEWHKGEAWLPTAIRIGKSLRTSIKSDGRIGRESATSLEDPGSPLPPAQEADHILRLLSEKPEVFSAKAALRLLSYDVAMIRAKVARIWLCKPRTNDEQVLTPIFEDSHPSIALGALQGAIAGWGETPEIRGTKILKGLIQLAKNPAAAMALLDRLTLFDRVEFTGSTPPWTIFGALLPAVLRALPRAIRVHEAHLFASVKSAINELDSEAIAEICAEWIGWIEREIPTRLPGDYELGVAEIVVTRLPPRLPQRNQLFLRLLALPSTGALISVLRDLVDSWDKLSGQERSSVLQLLRSERKDRHWLEAVCITRRDVPRAIQRLALGRQDRLLDTPDSLVETLDPKLLSTAVAVFCGTPQPLWYLGTHHPGGRFDAIIRALELRPDHSLFPVAFNEAVRTQDDSRVCEIVRTAGPANAEMIFRLLLTQKLQWNGNWLAQSGACQRL